MTFHADFQLAIARKSGRIHDRSLNQFEVGILGSGQAFVFGSWSVTSLAVNSVRQLVVKDCFAALLNLLCFWGWIGVVAEDAVLGDDSVKVFLIRAFKTGSHTPVPVVFGIPGDGEFYQSAFCIFVEVAASLRSRTDDVIDALF